MNATEQRRHWNGNWHWINMQLWVGCYELYGNQDICSIHHYLTAAAECGAWG